MAGDANGELASTTSAAPLQPLSMALDASPPPRKEAWREGARICEEQEEKPNRAERNR